MTGPIEIGLPVVTDSNAGSMEFRHWSAETELKKNGFGISEPRKTESIPIEDFDMLLMPLVAYDKSGNRLGMGSGYYDRHLESLRDLHQPLRVGISYGLQEVDLIHKNDWDIPLHAIVNEHGWLTFD